jgi:hypothetical protein
MNKIMPSNEGITIYEHYLNVISYLLTWVKYHEANIGLCRLYVPSLPRRDVTVDNYISSFISTSSEDDVINPANIRTNVDNYNIRLVMGDIIAYIPSISSLEYNISPAIISLINTRTRLNTKSKIGRSVNIDGINDSTIKLKSEVKITDRTVIDNIDNKGWECYLGAPEDKQIALSCVTEKTGASGGLQLSSQYIHDTLITIFKLIKLYSFKYEGLSASDSNITNMINEIRLEIMGMLYPDLIESLEIAVDTSELTNLINESINYTLTLKLTGSDSEITFSKTL